MLPVLDCAPGLASSDELFGEFLNLVLYAWLIGILLRSAFNKGARLLTSEGFAFVKLYSAKAFAIDRPVVI